MAVKLKAKWTQSVYNFSYTGGEQTFTAPATGYYKLEVWGAQGGSATSTNISTTYNGGYGGYSIGITHQNINDKLYINIGGRGISEKANASTIHPTLPVNGGYNGGGAISIPGSLGRATPEGSGGGATHIAIVSGLLKNLSKYKNTGGTNISKEILIVAGGGGGAGNTDTTTSLNGGEGGSGGGYIGGSGYKVSSSSQYWATGGSQSTQGCGMYTSWSSGLDACDGGFGYGAPTRQYGAGGTQEQHGAAGGSGWYGGGASNYGSEGSGGGGSGYIGSSNLISSSTIIKHMVIYNNSHGISTSDTAATRTDSNINVSATATADYSKTGDGYARITYLGTSI